MLSELHSFIVKYHLISQDHKILLAVSGGVDSMVMAHLFMHLPYQCGIAHCNFSLRGEESDSDEELVKNFSKTNNIPFFSVRFDTRQYALNKGISVQMAARELRYEWFEETRIANGYDSIAVAHNLNDNVETLIINLVRGTGLTGLSGIRPRNGNIIRPLLYATREKIKEYSNSHNVIFREDRTNSDTKYTRNKIRHKVIPVLEEINPSMIETLTSEAERFSGLDEILTSYIEKTRNEISVLNGEMVIFSIPKLDVLKHNDAFLFELFSVYGLKNSQLPDLKHIIEGNTGSGIVTESHRILRNRNEIIVTGKEHASRFELVFKNLKELAGVFDIEEIEIDASFKIPGQPSTACLDIETIKFPLVIRTWEKGDFFYPLGMHGSKKLSDYFIDNKYSIPEKEKKQVLVSGDEIAWIIGDRIDDRFRIKSTTRRVLILRCRS